MAELEALIAEERTHGANVMHIAMRIDVCELNEQVGRLALLL